MVTKSQYNRPPFIVIYFFSQCQKSYKSIGDEQSGDTFWATLYAFLLFRHIVTFLIIAPYTTKVLLLT